MCRLQQEHCSNATRLLYQYIPACYVLGWMVRECHWGSGEVGTGRLPLSLLLRVLHMLLCLGGDEPARQKYFGPTVMALLTWTPWHSTVPGRCYSEEPCEATLSRLASACRNHPQLWTPDDVMDLYVLHGGRSRTYVPLCNRGPPPGQVAECARALRALYSLAQPTVAFVPWDSKQTTTKATTSWSATVVFPGELWRDMPLSYIAPLVRHVVKVVCSSQPSVRLVEKLDDTVPRKDEATEADDAEDCMWTCDAAGG